MSGPVCLKTPVGLKAKALCTKKPVFLQIQAANLIDMEKSNRRINDIRQESEVRDV